MADEQLMSVFKEGIHASYRVACLTTVPRVTNITRKSSFKPLGVIHKGQGFMEDLR